MHKALNPPAAGDEGINFSTEDLERSSHSTDVGKRIHDHIPLGPMQAGMFFQSLLATDDHTDSRGFDIEQLCLHFDYEIDAKCLATAWSLAVKRHSILATSFHYDVNESVQVVHENVHIPVTVKDWTQATEQQYRQLRDDFLREDRLQGFALDTIPLMRVTLLKLADSSTEMVWTFHHIILDGRSFAIVLSEVMNTYDALVQGTDIAIDVEQRPFADYIHWLQSFLDLQKNLDFFRNLLAGKSTPTPLPGAEPSSRPLPLSGYATLVRKVSQDTSRSARELAENTQTTLSTVINAAWAVVLSSFTGDEDVVFGSTRACRYSALNGEAKSMVGLFINTLPLRVRLSGEMTVAGLLKDIRQQIIDLRDHEHTPLQDIQTVSEIHHRTPLFQTLVMYENQDLEETLRLTGAAALAHCRPELIEQPSLPFNVTVFGGDEITIRVIYDRKRFRESVVDRLVTSMVHILGELSRDKDREIHTLELVSQEEKQQILVEWNDTRRPFEDAICIHELFERRVLEQPDAVAVEADDRSLTYGQLEERANRLAHVLRARGAHPGVYVGICLNRGLDLIVALLGVAKSGAAYLPLDPHNPPDRLAFMLEDAEAILVVTESRNESLFCTETLVIDGADSGELAAMPTARPPRIAKPTDVCYAIFTSGSTGKPKGVVLTHRAVINTLEWVNRTYEASPKDRLLFVTSPCFDLSVYDIFGTLGAGGTVVVATDADLKDPQRIADMVFSKGITIWDSAPAALQRLVSFFPDSAHCSPLRLVMLSGDWIPVTLPDQIRQIFNRPKVMSMGGATEAAIWSNWYPIGKVNPGWTSIPYGTPIQNSRYHILDAHLRVVPVGVVGDLYIGGTCLASGYLNRPGLTAERFIDDPFRPGERLYKTGDLARYFDDGCMEFLGRADFQVKIRGYRVELGEIEGVLNNLDGIKEAVCSTFEDASGQKSLVAYIVREQNVELVSNEVKAKVAKKVPEYMVPSLLVFLEEMPISSNGKVDRKALPDPTHPSRRDGFIAPRNDIEKAIAAVWEEVLGKSPIGIHDDFFDLGGHSLLAVMLVTRLSKEFNEEIPLTMVLDHHTIAEQADSLASPSLNNGSRSLLVPLNTQGNRTPIFLFTGAGGFAFVFHRLSAALPPDQPVYVLNAVGTRDQGGGDNYTIEEMADIYEEEIEAVCDEGPIVLGGYSVGALLAFALANRFQKKKRDVKRIISFDGFAPQFPKLLPLPLRVASHIHALLTAKPDERRKYLYARWQNVKNRGMKLLGRDPDVADEKIVDVKLKAQVNRIGAAFWEARSRYNPAYTVSCPLVLFKCEILEQWAGNKMDDLLYGWEPYLTGPVKIIILPGEHLQMFNDENIQLITDELSRIQESDSDAGEVFLPHKQHEKTNVNS